MSWANEGLNCVNVIHCYRFTFRGKQKCSLKHQFPVLFPNSKVKNSILMFLEIQEQKLS